MKYKVKITMSTILIVIFLYNNCFAHENRVLVLYDTYKSFASDYSNLNEIIKIIMFCNNTSVKISKITSSVDNLNSYKKIIVLNNENISGVENEFLKLKEYKGDILWFCKSYNQVERLNEMIDFKANKISVFNLSLNDYKNIEETITNLDESTKHLNKKYLVLNRIYPFIDIKEFLNKVDFLNEEGIPFICEVMPLYDNTDFEAMKRFGEALNYAQSKGGRIVLHVPIFYLSDANGEEVLEKTKVALLNYMNYKVYPVAFSIPDSWIYKEEYKDVIKLANTIIVERDTNFNILNFDDLSINRYNAVIEKISLDEALNRDKELNSVGITVDYDSSFSNLKESIYNLKKKQINIGDIGELNTNVKVNENEIRTDDKSLFFNNDLVMKELLKP